MGQSVARQRQAGGGQYQQSGLKRWAIRCRPMRLRAEQRRCDQIGPADSWLCEAKGNGEPMGEGIARDCCTRRKTARRTCLSRNTGVNPRKLAEIPGRIIRLRTQPEENSCGEADGGASARPEPRHKDELSDPGGGPADLRPSPPLGRLAVFLISSGHGSPPRPRSRAPSSLALKVDTLRVIRRGTPPQDPAWAQDRATLLDRLGDRVQAEPFIRQRSNERLKMARPAPVERERPDGSAKIRETVTGWDKHETADRIELYIGRDLQGMRMNGTLVGGVVGLRIDSLSHGLFSGFSSPGPRRRGGPIRWRLWLASR